MGGLREAREKTDRLGGVEVAVCVGCFRRGWEGGWTCHGWWQPPNPEGAAKAKMQRQMEAHTRLILRSNKYVLSSYHDKGTLRNTVKLRFSLDWKLTTTNDDNLITIMHIC